MTKDEALTMAMEALERISDRFDLESVAQDATKAITAIKEALAQPPQRPWVGLTDEEHNDIYNQCQGVRVGSAISRTEAKLKEKTHDQRRSTEAGAGGAGTITRWLY
jgi:hypothetical protein